MYLFLYLYIHNLSADTRGGFFGFPDKYNIIGNEQLTICMIFIYIM